MIEAGADVNMNVIYARYTFREEYWTVLMAAAGRGCASSLRILAAAGADVNARSASGMTALWYAAQYNKMNSVLTLLELGADAWAARRCAARTHLGSPGILWDHLSPGIRQVLQREMDRRVAAALSVMPDALPQERRRKIIDIFTSGG